MAMRLADELQQRGWPLEAFNWRGQSGLYVRVALSYIRRHAVFEPMTATLLDRKGTIPIREILQNRPFAIDARAYLEHLPARWIDNQDGFPFGQWLIARHFQLMALWAISEDGRQFRIEYPAFSSGYAVMLGPLWPTEVPHV